MPKVALLSTNFTGGEFAPSLAGRVDVAKYNNSVKRMENFHPRIQGGARTRGGSAWLGAAKGDGRLIPFVYSRQLAYQLEFTANAVRFWRADQAQIMAGGAPLELATPYDLASLERLNYEQGDDTMFLFHPDFFPRRLQRLSDASWRLDAAPFVVQPFTESGYQPTSDGALSAASIGTGRTLTTATATFLASDVGRTVIADFGSADITAVASSTSATVSITAAFNGTTLAAGTWLLDGSPQAFIYPAAKDPVGATIAITAALPRAASVTLSGTTTRTVTAAAPVFTAADVGRRFYADAGVLKITAWTSTTLTGTLESTADFLSTTYSAGGWGITGEAFRPGDLGSYISASGTGALYRIVQIPDATTAMAEIRTAASALIAVPPGAWSLQGAVWSAATGYPSAGALYEQRLWFAGTRAKPQTLWASRIGEYLNFESGVNDSDAFEYTLNTHQRNQIRHLAYTKRLFALTEGLEASLIGGNEKAIGPTNIQKQNESANGTGPVRPVVVGKEALFVQGAGLKVRALGYSAASDGFDSPDRTVFAEHITASGIRDMAYQSEPDSLIYAVRNDGQMAVCAYSIDQEVIGWSRYLTTGAYRSVSVVPVPTLDAVWTLVRRNVAGVDRFYVEVLDEVKNTDAAVVLFAGNAGTLTTWTGLGHLEGMEVSAKGDGINLGRFTVSGGAITVPRGASAIEIGLPLLPLIEMLQPEVAGNTGTHIGSNISVNQHVIRVLATQSIVVNGQEFDFRKFGDNLLDRPPPIYSGDLAEITLTDDLYRPTLIITQPLPYAAHILAVVRKVTVNDL